MILAIDPGWNLVSWAIGDRQLEKVGQEKLVADIEYRFTFLAARIKSIIAENNVSRVVVERPTSYYHKDVDSESIIKISLIAGVCAGCSYLPLFMPTAPDWKGSVKKKIHNNRVLANLSEMEIRKLAPFVSKKGIYDHNIVDAIGIWLWYENNIRGRENLV